MVSIILEIILVPAAFAFILGFMAHLFKTQANQPATLPSAEESSPEPSDA
jgi:hypothetical protein